MNTRVIICLVLGISLLASPAVADWDPGQPAKWVQLPDLSPLGIDIDASRQYILADDFECTETGFITDIHIWGSWLNDQLPFGDSPEAVDFLLSIHQDIPAEQSPTEYSMPGEILWERLVPAGEFAVREFATQIEEGWMDPPDQYIFPGDRVCWQYNFFIDPALAFKQEGTATDPIVYWLNVRALPHDADAWFGWKTSVDHWNDDAVWGDGPDPYNGPWFELIYPQFHELAGQSIDLAFVITGEVQTGLDFGDAPDPNYPTLLANLGANHVIVPNIFLGASIDGELDGQPDAAATGDDNDGNDDEDGVVFTSALAVGQVATVDVMASTAGLLNAWIDYGGDGSWADPTDHVFFDLSLAPGLNNLSFMVPSTAVPGTTFARFRFSTVPGLTFTRGAPDGEVEDYMVGIEEGLATIGDRVWEDLNADGIQDVNEPGLPGVTVELYDCGGNLLQTTTTNAAGDYAFTTLPGNYFVRFLPPPNYQFSPQDQGMDDTLDSDANPITGSTVCTTLDPGEVDLTWDAGMYRVPDLDFGDAPEPPDGTPGYPTTLAFNGARHTIVPNVFMGLSIDPEFNGQPDATATGDDLDGNDDEDGVVFTSAISPGMLATVNVSVSVPGFIEAWIDFGYDNSWAEPGDQIFAAQPVVPGTNALAFPVPVTASAGPPTFARFRFSTLAGLSFDGPAIDGEVEDYRVGIEEVALEYGDAPASYRTLLVNDGPRHVLRPGLQLGPAIDIEPDGQPHPNALGDDLNNQPDEDGVVFLTPLVPGTTANVQIDAPGGGILDAWLDFGIDGSFGGAGDQIFASATLAPGPNILSFPVPAAAVVGTSFARFRISANGGLSYAGLAADGEVEDYQIEIEESQLDFGDAPEIPGTPGYPTKLALNGARHNITPNLTLGLTIDPELDGQPDPTATGDDLLDGFDDEDGVVFTSLLTPGSVATVAVTSSAPARLDAWIDFDGSLLWSEPGDQIFVSQPVLPGVNNLAFPVPLGAVQGATFARFRLSNAGGLPSTGWAPDGEVEDYRVFIEEPQAFKWIQPPDLSVEGIDVNASKNQVLADDFLCTETGRITRIHVWGSWLNDQLPFQTDPGGVTFYLSLHSDIPVNPPDVEYSRPVELLWERVFQPGTFTYDLFASQIEEGWLFPPDQYSFPADWTCWRYSFDIPADEAFRQIGTPEEPVVYWLDLKALPQDPDAWFGWKTSVEHWNDDAVWGDGPEPYLGPWFELRYPIGHPQETRSIDLAFALESAPEPAMDFGDAPDPTYETLWANDGARHIIDATVYMGAGVDADPDGQPDPGAAGDDVFDGNDDEDGVVWLTPLKPNVNADIEVIASVPGFVSLWIDMLGNGNWSDADDQMFIDLPVVAGTNLIQWQLPQTGGQEVTTFARIRYSTAAGLNTWTGMASDGEVEDYRVFVELDVTGVGDTTPRRLELQQNYPNPFNPQTTVKYQLNHECQVKLAVYDQRGSLVRVLVDAWKPAGSYSAIWDGRDDHARHVASGVYTILLRADDEERRIKAVLVR